MREVITELYFLTKVFYIIFSECVLFLIYRDYSKTIEQLTHRLAKINILYVKVFQAFALNNHFINDEMNNKLIEFTDNAPWDKTDIRIGELIKITDAYNLEIENGMYCPINSGMVSLVYKAHKRDDPSTQFVIKMKRNNLDERLESAIKNLLFFIKLISFLPIINKYKLDESVQRNIDMIQHQTNFAEEVENIVTAKNNFKNIKYVVIPEVFEEVTRSHPNFILMEYIDGIKIDKVLKEDYEIYSKLIVKFGFIATMVHGFAHGDLHCGNVLFIKDNTNDTTKTKYKHKIGIIDFGIMLKMDSSYRERMFDILSNMFINTPKENAEKMLYSGLLEPINTVKIIPYNQKEILLGVMENIFADMAFKSKQFNQLQIYKFLEAFTNFISDKRIQNLGIGLSDYFVKTQVVLAMAHGVTMKLCDDDFAGLADKVINELFHTSLLFDELN